MWHRALGRSNLFRPAEGTETFHDVSQAHRGRCQVPIYFDPQRVLKHLVRTLARVILIVPIYFDPQRVLKPWRLSNSCSAPSSSYPFRPAEGTETLALGYR